MRTTIELTDDLRARLLALAAKRKLRGYSTIVREVLERHLDEAPEEGRTGRGAKAARVARRVRGSLSKAEADRMRRRIERLWERWR